MTLPRLITWLLEGETCEAPTPGGTCGRPATAWTHTPDHDFEHAYSPSCEDHR